jgi:flavin reductase (DIM6/NTAB) family NADH-FMN oxidoreductase RutF
MPMQAVPLDKVSRLLNHGPTVLVGSAHAGRFNVMSAAWAMPLDFDPPKVAVVIDKATLTRDLVDASGVLSICVPCVAQADLTRAVGGESGKDHPDKLQRCGVSFDPGPETGCPLVHGAIAWMECRVLPATAHVAVPHDLILAEVVSAWSDARVFSGGRWHFEGAPDPLRSLHHVAGGFFYAVGSAVAPDPDTPP